MNKIDFSSIKNQKVRTLLNQLSGRGYRLNPHTKINDLINVHCLRKRKNVLGDVRINSERGSFRLQDEIDGKWKSFRKFDFSIDEHDFVDRVLDYID